MRFRILEKPLLEAELHRFTQLISGWAYCQWGEDNFLYNLPAKWELSFAAYEHDELAGFCFASNKGGVYYIHLFYLAPEYRGRLLGEQMIRNAVAVAKNCHLGAIELRCPTSNEVGLKFYKKNGFSVERTLCDEVSGEEADYYLQLKC
jgi:ribosomal protein S18 acetylase RimI-like enzyme